MQPYGFVIVHVCYDMLIAVHICLDFVQIRDIGKQLTLLLFGI